MKKLILAIAIMMSAMVSAKNVSAEKQNRTLVADSVRIEYLNAETDYTYPHWFMEKGLDVDSIPTATYFFELGATRYKVTRKEMIKAAIGKRMYGNYWIRNAAGRKASFYFENYED